VIPRSDELRGVRRPRTSGPHRMTGCVGNGSCTTRIARLHRFSSCVTQHGDDLLDKMVHASPEFNFPRSAHYLVAARVTPRDLAGATPLGPVTVILMDEAISVTFSPVGNLMFEFLQVVVRPRQREFLV
jgi:hypothetical protein